MTNSTAPQTPGKKAAITRLPGGLTIVTRESALGGTWLSSLLDSGHRSLGLVEGATKREATRSCKRLAEDLGLIDDGCGVSL